MSATNEPTEYEPDMVCLPRELATADMNACTSCFFDETYVTPCPDHLAALCQGCYRPVADGDPNPCADCAQNAW